MNLERALGHLTDAERSELDTLLQSLPARPPTFREFVQAVRPGYQWYRHCRELGAALEQVDQGAIRRLMVFMPPRHGKSEEISRLFTAYFLRRDPGRWVGITSYSADLAYDLSRAARQFYRGARDEVELSGDAAAVKRWETGLGGGLWAAGVGGPLTGRGGHLLVIDDPIKNDEEAASETIRAKQKDWYDSTFYTRLEPGGRIILVMTRWHEDDLAGYILSKSDADAEPWHIIEFPAVKDEEAKENPYPANCLFAPDHREMGAALCPERYDLADLQAIRRSLGSYYWSALYQQRPRAREGHIFKPEWFIPAAPAAPSVGTEVRFWDKAATEGAGDWTVGVKMIRTPEGKFYITDVKRFQKSAGDRDRLIRATAESDGHGVRIAGEQEPGASGKDAAQAFVRLLRGYAVQTVQHRVDKVLRAEPMASAAEVGDIKIVKGVWNAAFLDEIAAFDKGRHDDQVDAAAGAFTLLVSKIPMLGSFGGGESDPLARPSEWFGAPAEVE